MYLHQGTLPRIRFLKNVKFLKNKKFDIEDENKNGGLYPYDPIQEDIDIRQELHTVFELMKNDQGKLIINPDPT